MLLVVIYVVVHTCVVLFLSFQELRTLCCDLFRKTFECTNLFDQQSFLHHEFVCTSMLLLGHYDDTHCVLPYADYSVL